MLHQSVVIFSEKSAGFVLFVLLVRADSAGRLCYQSGSKFVISRGRYIKQRGDAAKNGVCLNRKL